MKTMTNKEILEADILDILFENRNKAYGAYALRKNYNHRLGLALGSALSLVLGIFLFSVSSNKKSQNTNPIVGTVDSVILIDLHKKKDKPIDQTKSPQKNHEQIAQSTYNNIQIVKNDSTHMPTQSQL